MPFVVRSGLMAWLMICLVACTNAADPIAEAESESPFRAEAANWLRGNALSNWARDAQEENDEEDDDDDSEDPDEKDDLSEDVKEATPVDVLKRHQEAIKQAFTKEEGNTKTQDKPEAKAVALHSRAEPEYPIAAHKDAKEDALEDALEDAKEDEEDGSDAVEDAEDDLNAAQSKLETFNDDKAFDAKIASEVKQMANETQSPALSNFLGDLRTEMRVYAKPSYPAYLESKVAAEEKHVKELEVELQKKNGEGAQKVSDSSSVKLDEAMNVSKQKAGETWALSFFANITLLTVVFAMASSKNNLVKNHTWVVIDQVIAIFLAVMYFHAFGSLLDYATMGSNAITASVLHAIALLAMILVLAFLLKKDKLGLAILCGAGAHIASFSSIHAATSVQNYWLGMSYYWSTCIFGMLVLALGLATIGYLVHTAKKKAQLLDDDVFMDKTDDLENDFGAMAFSVVFTMFVRFVLTGHHPKDDETGFEHTQSQRLSMFLYACVCLLAAGVVITYSTKYGHAESNSYGVKRLTTFVNTVACMNVAWAFLYWGEWEFFETMYPDEAIKGRVIFAILATVLCGLGLIGLTKLPAAPGIVMKKERLVALTALSLICAWSWELCFDTAVEAMAEGVAHPVAWKCGTTLFAFAIVLPVYAFNVKPIAEPAADAIGA